MNDEFVHPHSTPNGTDQNSPAEFAGPLLPYIGIPANNYNQNATTGFNNPCIRQPNRTPRHL